MCSLTLQQAARSLLKTRGVTVLMAVQPLGGTSDLHTGAQVVMFELYHRLVLQSRRMVGPCLMKRCSCCGAQPDLERHQRLAHQGTVSNA